MFDFCQEFKDERRERRCIVCIAFFVFFDNKYSYFVGHTSDQNFLLGSHVYLFSFLNILTYMYATVNALVSRN